MRRRVGTAASATPRKRGAERRNNKVFMNVCTVFFFGMVRAQRGEAEPSPPPYVYSLPGLAPPYVQSLLVEPLCTVLPPVEGRALWQSQSECSFLDILVRRWSSSA